MKLYLLTATKFVVISSLRKKKKKKVSQTVITHSNTNSLSVVFEGDSKVVLLALKMVMKFVDFEGDSQVFPFLLQNL